jgi:hypothetical protein
MDNKNIQGSPALVVTGAGEEEECQDEIVH